VTSNTANLTQGEADIAVRLFRPEEVDLVVKYLGKMEMGLCASEKYKKLYGFPDDLNGLFHHRIISYGEQLSILPENQWLLARSEDSLRVLSSDSTLTRIAATISGVGISIQPKILMQLHPELSPLLKEASVPFHKVWLVYHKDIRHMARIRIVVEFLSKCIGGLIAEK
jgi:DNA-binding transcriptional LysR family regulator